MKRVGVVGAGISGLAAAYLLSRRYDVHLFEKDARLGGHTHTVMVDSGAEPIALDTGFLVHNERTYPLLCRLFRELGIGTRDSDMSFSVSCPRTGLEYSSRGARGFFAQPHRLASPAHLALLRDIIRFNRLARASVDVATDDDTVGQFLDRHRFGPAFTGRYLYPMASAIWSASLDSIRDFPLLTLARFLENHGLLQINGQPVWKVVRGGSASYIPRLTAPLDGRVHRAAQIRSIARRADGVRIAFADRPSIRVDEIVFACHGDEVLPLLADPSDRERDIFAQFKTTTNDAWLHTDQRMLPRRAHARASWNYRLPEQPGALPTVTYDLNRLQSLTTPQQYCVTLNPGQAVDERTVIKRMTYAHPLYTRDAIRAQARWPEVSGVQGTHFCGAYWFNGFHEDGLRSAVRVATALGVTW